MLSTRSETVVEHLQHGPRRAVLRSARWRVGGLVAASVVAIAACGSSATESVPAASSPSATEVISESSESVPVTESSEPEPEPETIDAETNDSIPIDTNPSETIPDAEVSVPDTAVPEPQVTEIGLLEDQAIDIDGVDRSYHLYLPADPIDAPLVLVFHQGGSSADATIGLDDQPAPHAGWFALADQEGIIVAVPDGVNGGWNDCRADSASNPDVDDVAFTTALIDELVEERGADPARVYATGTSNGGHMSLRLATEIPDKITAFAAVAAANPGTSECAAPTEPVPAMFINGDADPLMPYEGGAMITGSQVASAVDTVDDWATRNGATAEPLVEDLPDVNTADGSSIVSTTRSGGVADVVLYTVVGGGHTDPSLAHRHGPDVTGLFGAQNADVETAAEVWAFFATT